MMVDLSIYAQRLNLEEASFKLIEHEDAIVGTVYKVALPDGATYILKICLLPRHYARDMGFTIRTNTWNGRNASFYQWNREFVEDMFR